MRRMRYLSLFSGIGGFDLGFDRAGMECAGQVEIDDYCQRVLAKHWPDVPRMGDIREVKGHEFGTIDVICGGFPCQPHSVAGKRKGSADKRDLWGEFARLIRAIKPRWVVAENTRGLLSSENGQFFGRVLRDLAGIGYDAEWHVLSACAFGAPHTRERVFIIAYPTGYRRKGKLLEIIPQAIHDLSPETLGVWHGSSDPFADVAKLLASPGTHTLPHGVSSGVAVRPALRAYGNAVVPQIAEWLGRRIIEATP